MVYERKIGVCEPAHSVADSLYQGVIGPMEDTVAGEEAAEISAGDTVLDAQGEARGGDGDSFVEHHAESADDHSLARRGGSVEKFHLFRRENREGEILRLIVDAGADGGEG